MLKAFLWGPNWLECFFVSCFGGSSWFRIYFDGFGCFGHYFWGSGCFGSFLGGYGGLPGLEAFWEGWTSNSPDVHAFQMLTNTLTMWYLLQQNPEGLLHLGGATPKKKNTRFMDVWGSCARISAGTCSWIKPIIYIYNIMNNIIYIYIYNSKLMRFLINKIVLFVLLYIILLYYFMDAWGSCWSGFWFGCFFFVVSIWFGCFLECYFGEPCWFGYCQEWEMDQLLQFCMHNFIFWCLLSFSRQNIWSKYAPLEGISIK